MTPTADLILQNGEVFTVDPMFSIAEAIAVADGRIIAVGETATIRDLIGKQTRVIDLNGRAVLPGINDSHLHGCAWGTMQPPLQLDVSFPAVRSIEDIKRMVAAEVARMAPGEPIVGIGYDEGYLDECKQNSRRVPTRWDLDEVAPNNPVHLMQFSGHASWVNTAWLTLANVTGEEEVPPGGVVPRDERGVLGLFYEGAAHLVRRALPGLDEQTIRQSIGTTLRELHALGITSYTEAGLGVGGEKETRGRSVPGVMGRLPFDVYEKMALAGDLTARLSVLWMPRPLSGVGVSESIRRQLADVRLSSSVDPHRMRLAGVKLIADGVPPNKTAWMREEYVTGGTGEMCVHGESEHEQLSELHEMVRLAHEAGMQVGVHVTGDAAIDAVVSAFAKAAAATGSQDLRHYVIHGDFVTPDALRRLAAGGFGLNMNPAIKWTISDLMDEVVGPERSAWQWPVASAIGSGVQVAGSSDAPVVKPDWRLGVAGMMLRESKATGRVSGPDQVVGLADAVRAYTAVPAWQDHAEDWKGTLEVGKVADLCVLGAGLRHLDPHDLPEIPIDMTVFDGTVVHNRAA